MKSGKLTGHASSEAPWLVRDVSAIRIQLPTLCSRVHRRHKGGGEHWTTRSGFQLKKKWSNGITSHFVSPVVFLWVKMVIASTLVLDEFTESLDINTVTGMLNVPGCQVHCYSPFRNLTWQTHSAADLVFPNLSHWETADLNTLPCGQCDTV